MEEGPYVGGGVRGAQGRKVWKGEEEEGLCGVGSVLWKGSVRLRLYRFQQGGFGKGDRM